MAENGPPGQEESSEPIVLFGDDDQEEAPAAAPTTADVEPYITFSYGGSTQIVQLLPNQAITTSQIVGLFGDIRFQLNSDQLILTQDGVGPRIRIFPVSGSFQGLRVGRSYFVDVQSGLHEHESISSGTGAARPAVGFLPIVQTRPVPPAPASPLSPTPGSVKITVTLGEWAGRGSRIESQFRQLPIKLSEATANVEYIKGAVRSHFQDDTLELFSGNKCTIEDSDATRGLEAWRNRTTPKTRYWACSPPPTIKRSLGQSSEAVSQDAPVTQASLAKALKTAFEKLENLPSTSAGPAQPPTGPPAFTCALCYGPVLPNIKICKECGQIVCGTCIDGVAARASAEYGIFKCPFCREEYAHFMPVRGLQ